MSKRAKNKKRQDFEATVLPHLDALYGSALRLTRNARDAEDLIQETMLRAFRFWDSYDETSNCKGWLFRILTNTFINEYQRKKRSREIVLAAANEQRTVDGVLAQEAGRGQRTPEEVLLEGSLSEDVEKALATLPEDFRIVVLLCDVEDFSYKEIAEIVDCPVGTVMSRLHRARRLLKSQLSEFAKAEGIIKPEPTVCLDSYRRSRKVAQERK